MAALSRSRRTSRARAHGRARIAPMMLALGLMPTASSRARPTQAFSGTPFVSYGGWAMLADLIAIGVLLMIARLPASGADAGARAIIAGRQRARVR